MYPAFFWRNDIISFAPGRFHLRKNIIPFQDAAMFPAAVPAGLRKQFFYDKIELSLEDLL